MSNLELIDNVLNEQFKNKTNYLEEKAVNMKIKCDTSCCRSFIFKFDIQLDRSYKGGFFPFFSNSKGVNKRCDYIIFSEIQGKLFALIIELKAGTKGSMPQLNAGECFVDYVINTVNRVNNKSLAIEKRKISIRNFRTKRYTRVRDVKYDQHNHHTFQQTTFRIHSFLK